MRIGPSTLAAIALGALFSLACGGGGTTSPAPVAPPPPAAPTPTPVPAATPTPVPCTQGLCEPPVTNTAPPQRVSLRLYWVRYPSSNDFAFNCTENDALPVGYTIAVDMTAKDAQGRPTNGQSNTAWRYDGTDELGDIAYHNAFQPWIKIRKPGRFQVQGVLDGVRSTWLFLTFVPDGQASCVKR